MSFSKNFSFVLLCLAVGFVTCNCAPTLDTETLLAQILQTDWAKEPLQLRQVVSDGESEQQGGEVVEPTEVAVGEEEELGEVEVDGEDEDEDGITDEEWAEIISAWGNGQGQDLDEDEDGWIEDDDWEDDFDYIDNKETEESE